MKLILEPRRCASWPADHRQTQRTSQSVGRGAKLDLGILGPNRFSGQVGEEKARVGAVGKADASGCGPSQRMATVDALELMALRPAMGKGSKNQEAGHEAESTGRKSVSGLEGETVSRCPYGCHRRQHLTTER